VAVLVPLALGHPDHHPLAVDVAGLQMHRFGDAQAGGVAAGQDRTMLEALDASEKMRTSSRLRTLGSLCGIFGAGRTSSNDHCFLRVILYETEVLQPRSGLSSETASYHLLNGAGVGSPKTRSAATSRALMASPAIT
jgi:hypothetical protein